MVMRKPMLGLVLSSLVLAVHPVRAADEQHRWNAYAFAGGGGVAPKFTQQVSVRRGSFLSIETREWKSFGRLGMGAGVTVAGGLEGDCELGMLLGGKYSGMGYGVFSPGLGYHFIHRGSPRFDPFAAVGYTRMWARGLTKDLLYAGGGANFWSKRFGLRLEFRDHIGDVSGFPYVWSAHPSNAQGSLQFWEIRVGIAVR
jgi:hypothetical protein